MSWPFPQGLRFAPALLGLQPAAKHQRDANTADGNALPGKSTLPILLTFQKQAASGGGTRAAGRTQHWEPNPLILTCATGGFPQ